MVLIQAPLAGMPKHIAFDNGDVYVFSCKIRHSDFAAAIPATPISAGFVDEDGVWGESDSLGLKADESLSAAIVAAAK